MTTRRALVIGGSLGGLIAAHLLRSTGWDATVFERNDEELASRGVGLGTHPQLIAILKRAGDRFRRDDGDQADAGGLPRRKRQDFDRAADGAHAQRLVAALPRFARCAAGANLPARQKTRSRRTGRAGRHRDLCRRHARARRSSGRGRRRPLDGARAILAGSRARLRRLCRLARLDRRSRRAARAVARDGRSLCVLPARGRAIDQLCGAGARQRHRGRPPRLQHRLVPAGGSRRARRYLHRRRRPPPCRGHSAAADPARCDRPHQSRRQGRHRAADRRDFCARRRRSFSRSTI